MPRLDEYSKKASSTKKAYHWVYRNGRNAGYGTYRPANTKRGLSKPRKKR